MDFYQQTQMTDMCSVQVDTGLDKGTQTYQEGINVWNNEGDYVFIPFIAVDFRLFTNSMGAAIATDGQSSYVYLGDQIATIRIQLFIKAYHATKEVQSFVK